MINVLNNQYESAIDDTCTKAADAVASVLININPTLTDESLYHSLQSRNKLSQFQMAIDSTNVSQDKYISYDDETISDNTSLDDSRINEYVLLYKISKRFNTGTFNADDII